MYLKSLEMIGFKSFADKTRLEFEPGITAVVGPNGCGKSNISDAIRWVIGETSAKAVRGTSMTDCIFNGTDARKPTAMAEVSLMLADCEKALGTEFNEVTISRRVFRSGEGQYFINKTPCRLRDIQRLFMDTGIGTTSYSLMEQGKIDRVLSSRPEDRREVFEEASGITKFKSDKAEALRKLEHTEANLLRLADVIREVKRQIGSLQRQAGKARRYKEIREQLRELELFSTQERLKEADKEIRHLENEIANLTGKVGTVHRDVEALEEQTTALHTQTIALEREIAAVQETGGQAQSRLDRTRDLITVNRTRIDEYQNWAARSSREIDDIQRQLEENRTARGELQEQREAAAARQKDVGAKLAACSGQVEAHKKQIDTARARIQTLRDETVQVDTQSARLQNQLVELERKERAVVVQRERLAAERVQLTHVATTFERRQLDMVQTLKELQGLVAEAEQTLIVHDTQRREAVAALRTLQQTCADIQSQAAARRAQVDMLQEDEDAQADYPGGSRLLLDKANPLNVDKQNLLGTLASAMDVKEGYSTAVEAALRPWLDAVVLRDGATAQQVLEQLSAKRAGAARLLTLTAAEPVPAAPTVGTPLCDVVTCREDFAPLLRRLLGHVAVVANVADIPAPIPAGQAFVTQGGALATGAGAYEYWMTDTRGSNPLARRTALTASMRSLAALEKDLAARRADATARQESVTACEHAMAEARTQLDQDRRSMAQKEGENQVLQREAKQARERLETVSWEIENLEADGAGDTTEREAIAKRREELTAQRDRAVRDIQAQTRELETLEARYAGLQTDLTEHRVAAASLAQKTENLDGQCEAVRMRVAELEAAARSRTEGVTAYEQNIRKLAEGTADAESQLAALETAVAEAQKQADDLRTRRAQLAGELQRQEQHLAQRRTLLEELRNAKSAQEVRCAESRMRRQNQLDRVVSEYHVTLDQITDAPEPRWEDGVPLPIDTCENRVAELRTKIEAMGPVNLVAIDEYKELEERFAFLTTQEEDLIKAKQQLMDMIRKINRTTSDLFRATFDQINANFQEMFKRLFNGGTAQLVLVNEEDILECGIEIIARPPGKRLQNISLLSGGERTLTAVALLFAIYMIKPSPFCVLDELDAPLDDSNIGRFIEVLKSFVPQSQFVIITHSQHTIAAANVLYGVTMPDKGISKLVSMRFKESELALPAGQAPAEDLRA